MNQIFPTPDIKPFERLKVRDGLLINAERWQKVQEYHRIRQNFHYQSLHQPGIVCGLGVKIITANSVEPAKYRDGKSVQLQPGIAIDLQGNPIIVPHPENIQISVQPPKDTPISVYLVVTYRDPEDLAVQQQGELVRENFRIDFKITPPSDLEVEICRILLPPNQPINLTNAADIFFPGYHNLDFRFRHSASIRHQGIIKIAQITHEDSENNRNFINLDYLIKAIPGLYAQLKGIEPVGLVNLGSPALHIYDLIYLTGKKLNINSADVENLKKYLENGGVILFDAPSRTSELFSYVNSLAQTILNTELKPLSKRHSLRRQPFLFAALPLDCQEQPLEILVEGGIILVSGDLASLWGLDEQLSLSRETIRSAQELGINILNYAWKRRTMISLQS